MRAAGQAAEDRALDHLQARGLAPLARNFHCRGGELDLVMLDGGTLVFVEVRSRRSERYGSAAASITPRKQARLTLAARYFLARHPQHAARPCRFDVVTVTGTPAAGRLNWIPNAFEVS